MGKRAAGGPCSTFSPRPSGAASKRNTRAFSAKDVLALRKRPPIGCLRPGGRGALREEPGAQASHRCDRGGGRAGYARAVDAGGGALYPAVDGPSRSVPPASAGLAGEALHLTEIPNHGRDPGRGWESAARPRALDRAGQVPEAVQSGRVAAALECAERRP